ncbi:MAG: aminotransferase class V-fold PLP-dependent enzyme [Alistipes sp.]|nr:aminotransferase class V-fold PLP-dependent enzyme [Alistipes sp.]
MAHSFGSDNHSGVHPLMIKAIEEANSGHVPAYGDDLLTAQAKDTVREVFGTDGEVVFMFNGTGANVLALRSVTRPYNAVFCASTAHTWNNECGAPECHTGCKFITLEEHDGKITPEQLLPHLTVIGNCHHNLPGAVTVAQSTEVGTVYTNDELRALADIAHAHNMYLHVDGTRLANAVAAAGCTAREMITETGVDVLSFGGTKNGMLLGESVVFINDSIGSDAPYHRKQLMQLASKMRYVAAQFETYISDGFWLRNAAHANSMASYLGELISGIPGIVIPYTVQTNMVFVHVPDEAIPDLKERGYYRNVDPAVPGLVRYVCSFDTGKEDVEALANALKEVL